MIAREFPRNPSYSFWRVLHVLHLVCGLQMPTPATIAEFLGLVRKSGLVDEQTLASVALGLPREPAACAEALVESRLLTSFQAKQLLAGRPQGLILGAYRILGPLGRGGMGTVYLAEHAALGRKAAIKVLNEEQSREKLALERFFREARAAAALDHPNIVRLHDIAKSEGTHFLVMEFVDGIDLQALIEQTGRLHFAQAANYIAQAAAGLQHAHERGFIHRDIKPANLILAKSGGVKILDMGLARSLSNSKDALTGQLDEEVITGTADFLSPEQALNVQLDPRTDIYSLGGTFYTLLTGRIPYEGSTAQKLSQHQMAPPPEVLAVRTDVPPELAAIIRVMMAKQPQERYQTAREVIAALAPWAPGVEAGAGTAVSLPPDTLALNWRQPDRTRSPGTRFARAMRSKGVRIFGCVGILLAVGLVCAFLGVSAPAPNPMLGADSSLPPASSRPSTPVTHTRWLVGHTVGVNDVVLSPDETRLASVDWGGKLMIWDVATGERLHECQTRPGACCLACTTTPDGRFILVAGERMPILVFEWATGREVREYPPHEPATWGLAVSPSGQHLLSCGNDGLVILRNLSTSAVEQRFEFEAKLVWTVAFSADGSKIAASVGLGPSPEESHLIKVWSTADGKLLHQLTGHTGAVRTIGFRPDGGVLASGAFDGSVRLWNLTTGKEIRAITAHDGVVERVFFLPDGRQLLTCGGPMHKVKPAWEGGAVKVWDADTGREVKSWRGGKWAELICLRPSKQGQFVVASGRDRNVRVWSLNDPPTDRLLYVFKLSQGSAFRSRYQNGEHSSAMPFELAANGVFMHCRKKESVAEFRGEPEIRPWIEVVNLNDDLSSQIIFQFDDVIVVPALPGKWYRVRLEYRTTNEAEGRMLVRNPKNGDFSSLVETRLDRTEGQWKVAELTFRRPPDGKIDVCIVNNVTGEENALAVRSVEVFELEPGQ